MTFARQRMAVLALILTGGCAPILPPTALTEIDDVRETPAVVEARELAPNVFAKAEKLRADATAAYDAEDLAGSQIIAEEALAAYEEAVAMARVARAEERRVAALAEVEDKRERLATVDGKLQQVEAAVRAADKRLEVIRELQPITPSDSADPDRERARAAVVATLRLEAQLLCSAGELLARARAAEKGFVRPDDELMAAKTALGELEKTLSGDPAVAPIDGARRARAQCLAGLSAVRRAKGAGAARHGDSDRLLAELSRRGLGSPRRDDRGVVLTFRSLFERDALGGAAIEALGAVGEVAEAHPGFPVMVIVHHASGDAASWRRRGETVVATLRKALGEERVADPVSAGAADPVVDPDGRYAARNDRVEIIFVSPRPL
jgi:hypothetical protein